MARWPFVFRLIGVILLSGTVPHGWTAASHAEDAARLWRIDRPGVPPSHLFGTMHSDDPRVTALPSATATAFAAAKLVAVEIILDDQSAQALGAASPRRHGPSAGEVLDAARRTHATAILAERHLPPELLDRLKPWALFLILSQPPMRGDAVLDTRLQRRAGERGQAVVGLETVDEQIDVFDGMDMPAQTALLAAAIDEYADLPATLETMTAAYLAGDLDRLKTISDQASPGLDPSIQTAVDRRMIDERNQRMAERLAEPLERGAVFVAVGALHLAGAEGLIELLRRRGWRVTPAD